MHANSKFGDQENVCIKSHWCGHIVENLYRCFLFLVNYARMKPDVAMKALPVLVLVSSAFQDVTAVGSDKKIPRIWRTQTR